MQLDGGMGGDGGQEHDSRNTKTRRGPGGVENVNGWMGRGNDRGRGEISFNRRVLQAGESLSRIWAEGPVVSLNGY